MRARNNPQIPSQRPLVCYVTERLSLPGKEERKSLEPLLKKVAELAQADVDWIQIREKDLTAKELAFLTREAVRLTANSPSTGTSVTRILINDRLDVALAERAHGVHLAEASLPPSDAKRLIQSAQAEGLVTEDFLLGVSCHSLDAAKAAASAGADYLILGPVFPTPSKARYGEPQGLPRLAEVCRTVSIPVLAIGGITLDNATSCLQAGAAGIAAIRLFQDSPLSSVQRWVREQLG